jgi:PPOX class probable F420-dependent enzyme
MADEPNATRPYMPGYGIEPADGGQGLLAWSWAVARLNASHSFWLATHWPDGRPHVMPVWAVWHDGALWFSSSKASRKARNLSSDPRCVLTTEDPENPVVLEGVAELLLERADLETLLRIENAKYGTQYGMDMLDPAENSAFRVRPRWAFGLRSELFTETPTRWIFE